MRCALLFIALSIVLFAGCGSGRLADADAAFFRGEYYDAQKIYRKVYNKLTDGKDRRLRGEIAVKMGECYTKLNMSGNAVRSYRNALRFGYADSALYLPLGMALQGEGRYEDAIEAYETFLDYQPGDILAREGIDGCRLAIRGKKEPHIRYVVKRSKALDTRRSDFSPMFAGSDFDRIYLTSTSDKAKGDSKSEITGMKRGDIYVSRKNERGQWQLPQPVEGELNSDADEGVISFSPDGQTMYLTRAVRRPDSDTHVDIYTSQRSDAAWSAPQKLEILSDTTSVAGHPAVSPDGEYLYFCSDMPGGYGGLDIWRVGIKDRKSVPVNLGPQINTPGNEMFPYVRSDSVIYFSSNGHPGFGGLDIFRARLNSTGVYWNVENMGLPVNSRGDDFGITFGEGESGFLSSNRDDARGRDHIYSFELPDIHVTISGTVTDRDEEPVANAVIRIVGDDGSNLKMVSRNDGTFSFPLDRGVRYVMKAGAEGYLNQKQEFTSDSAEEDVEYMVDFVLSAINKPQVVENIFYDFDKATLRPESREALDGLVMMLNDNPTITIEMGSHTDRKGTEDYNVRLSERRAGSVIDYLTSAGIAADRLLPKGYGESVPKTVTRRIHRMYPQFPEGTVLTEDYIQTLDAEDQEIADQINRRTEFRVLSLDYE